MVFTILYFIPVIGQLYQVFYTWFFLMVVRGGGDGMPMTMSVMWTGMQQYREI